VKIDRRKEYVKDPCYKHVSSSCLIGQLNLYNPPNKNSKKKEKELEERERS